MKTILLLSVLLLSVHAGEIIPVLTTKDGKVYRQASIRLETIDGLKIMHADGVATVPYDQLPSDLASRYKAPDRSGHTPPVVMVKADPEAIAGLATVDVVANLEQKGFTVDRDFTPDRKTWTCTHRDGHSVTVSSNDGKTATMIKGVSTATDAREFLAWLATLPYDMAKPAQAKAFVLANHGRLQSVEIGAARITCLLPSGLMILPATRR